MRRLEGELEIGLPLTAPGGPAGGIGGVREGRAAIQKLQKRLAGDLDSIILKALSKNPEAALLGLRGLTTAALKRGDETAALTHAEAALQSHPHDCAWD